MHKEEGFSEFLNTQQNKPAREAVVSATKNPTEEGRAGSAPGFPNVRGTILWNINAT
jgi:hypothetical protein